MLRLPGSAPPQFFEFFVVDLAGGLHEQLLFPPDFGAPNYLRQQTAHHRFDWAAVVGADPSGELKQLLAQDGRLADDRFDWPKTFRFSVIENRRDTSENRLLTKRNAHTGTDADSFRQCFWHQIIHFPVDRPISDNTNVIGFCHAMESLI